MRAFGGTRATESDAGRWCGHGRLRGELGGCRRRRPAGSPPAHEGRQRRRPRCALDRGAQRRGSDRRSPLGGPASPHHDHACLPSRSHGRSGDTERASGGGRPWRRRPPSRGARRALRAAARRRPDAEPGSPLPGAVRVSSRAPSATSTASTSTPTSSTTTSRRRIPPTSPATPATPPISSSSACALPPEGGLAARFTLTHAHGRRFVDHRGRLRQRPEPCDRQRHPSSRPGACPSPEPTTS